MPHPASSSNMRSLGGIVSKKKNIYIRKLMFYLSKNISQGAAYKYTFLPYLFHTRNYCFVFKLTSLYF